MSIKLGGKIERARPLKNPHLAEALRQFKGEYSIFVQQCAWRLDAEAIVCSWKSPNDNDGPMVSGLGLLVGQHVLSASITANTCDLVVKFSGGYTLRVFCDCFDQENDGDNYSLRSVNEVFTVGAGGVLRKQLISPAA